MRTFPKTLFLLILTVIFSVNSSFTKVTAQNFTQGIYKTSEDYLQHRLTLYDEIKLGPHGYKGTIKGEKVSGNYKDADFWGAQTEDGVAYRINKKANTADRIMTKGAVCCYAGMELVIKVFEDGRLKSQDINAPSGTKFSQVFWVSQGLDGEMMGASVDNLTKLFADSPALVGKVQQTGIDEKTSKTWLDTFTTVSGWIGEYDKAHQ